MRIDVHSHFIPAQVTKAAETGKDWHGVRMSRTETGALLGHAGGADFELPEWTKDSESPEQRLAQLDVMRLDAHVLSIAPRLQRYGADPVAAVPIARDMNDDLAEFIRFAPDRLRGL